MMFERKSILAKLLAKENVEVVQGSYKTAAFDVVNRKLMLPLWKEMSNDVYDLMVGHEVGHALFTPSEGWHESDVKFDFPRVYINIIEDIRIEREVLSSYPGLVANFKRGYKELYDQGFFGENLNIELLGFLDRLNLKAKMRDLLDVPFSSEEQPYYDMAQAANTFEEVLDVCQAIYEFLQEKKEEEQSNDANSEVSDYTDEGEGTGDSQESTYEDSAEPSDSQSESSDKTSEEGNPSEAPGSSSEEPEEVNDESIETDTKVKSSGQNGNVNESITDDNFRRNEGKLVETDKWGDVPTVVREVTAKESFENVAQYEEVKAARDSMIEKLREKGEEDWYIDRHIKLLEKTSECFDSFMVQTKKVVANMSKEFEMRKAAYQHSRATTGKTGALDVSNLHNYKFSDDLFLRTTKLADAKSHGMVMMMDFSGSMYNVIENVVDQTIALAMFCKKVGIPFEVYSFTTGGHRDYVTSETPELNLSNVKLAKHISSDMRAAQFKEAIKGLYVGARSSYKSTYDEMGGTPTIEALAIMRNVIKAFQAKHGVQKTNFVMISDGEPGYAYIKGNASYHGSKRLKFGKKYLEIGNPSKAQDLMIDSMKKELNLTAVCYYITSRKQFNRFSYYLPSSDKARAEFRKNGVYVEEKRGFDAWFNIDGTIDAMDDEFEVKENANKGDIARAFKKFAASKKTNRVFATKFAQVIS